MKRALIVISIFALAMSAVQAATKSDKRKANSTGQTAAASGAPDNSNSGRASNRGGGGGYKPAVTRYDPVGNY